jgi:hypothetical protein
VAKKSSYFLDLFPNLDNTKDWPLPGPSQSRHTIRIYKPGVRPKILTQALFSAAAKCGSFTDSGSATMHWHFFSTFWLRISLLLSIEIDGYREVGVDILAFVQKL